MRALITGGGGQLASDLQDLLGSSASSYSHDELDITNAASMDAMFAELKPDTVFNCAAFHNLDQCENDPDQAWAVNVRAVRELALRGARLVHFSTNYVFDGRRPEPYKEDDLPAPTSVYALTKLAGEHAALAYGRNSLVIRTGGLYGKHGSASKGGNFVDRMIRRARETGHLAVVDDQRLQPTYTADLAASVVAAVERDATGVVHLTAEGACSWCEFTIAIMDLIGLDVQVDPVRTTNAPGTPDRPLNGVLARERADRLNLPRLPHWREGLKMYTQYERPGPHPARL
jgi:dTDP-4-dehydrorhamnose reductase